MADRALTLTVAAGDYLHTLALREDEVREGVRLRYVPVRPAVAFRRMLEEEAFDVAEMSLATIYRLADAGDGRFLALPVFLSRVFRHSAIYVAPSVAEPGDLVGGDIGVLRYGMTMAVWARALLQEQGVAPGAVHWWLGESSDRPPPGISLRGIVDGAEALDRLAADGRLVALLSTAVPAAYRQGRLRRLFPDAAAAEREYHAQTGLFPIMHAVLVRRRIVDEHPGLLSLLFRWFCAARDRAEAALLDPSVSPCPLPWLWAYAEEVRARLGNRLWPYGLAANRATLEAFGAAMADQGLTRRRLAPEEVFALGGDEAS